MTKLMGYPSTAYGNLTSGGSVANLIAIKAARDAKGICSFNVRNSVVYLGRQTHHSILKDLNTTGLHECIVRLVPLDKNFRMLPGQLEQTIAEDRKTGLSPFLVVASAGTTDTGAVDPLEAIAGIAATNDMWFHEDAAYGGFFMLLEEMRERLRGIEKSDSVVMDPHKTLFLPFGSGAVLVEDVNYLLKSNAAHAPYLNDTEAVDDISPADTGVELSRPNRALRMWLPLQLHGVAAFRECLREKIALSHYFYEKIGGMGYEKGPWPDLTVSIFPYPEQGDKINKRLINATHRDGRVFLSSTVIDGKVWLRCAIVSNRTHKKEIDLTLEMLQECLEKVKNESLR